MTAGTHHRGRLIVLAIVVVIVGASIAYALQRTTATPAEPPPAVLQLAPSHGPVETTVRITGAGVGSTHRVTFDGISAPFTVDSSSQITAHVPTGVRPGATVRVATQGGNDTTARFTVTRPNIVFILTDDERLDDLPRMPIVKKDLTDHGVNFVNGFVTNPLCAPSRATILTGRYSHSTDVYWNSPPHGGYQTFAQRGDDRSTIATWLQSAGYRTAMIGKYMNGYRRRYSSDIPPGWTKWEAFTPVRGGEDKGGYFNYWMTINGRRVFYGGAAQDYSTTVWTNRALKFIQSTPSSQPLFLYLAMRAPHVPVTPAPEYAHACQTLAPLRPPSYNVPIVHGPAYIDDLPAMNASVRAYVDLNHLNHCRTLLSVDDAVGRVVSTLASTGRLSDTMIVFASDNGFEEGEHRWAAKKVAPYEEDLRVPIIVRYDPASQGNGTVNRNFVLNVDFAQTWAALAGVHAPGAQGMNFLPLLAGQHPAWRHDFLLEHWSPSDVHWYVPPYCGVQNSHDVYIEYSTGERELYNLTNDPYELQNVAAYPSNAGIVSAMRAQLQQMCRPPPPTLHP